MQALIGFFESFLKDKDTGTPTSNGNSGSNTGGGSGGGSPGTLRNLMDSDTEENIKKYLPRVYAMLVFLGIAGLSFIGWIVCIICCCADCCWCPCCKKVSCKIPFFIFTYIFYGLVVAVCLYGVTQASKVFVGIADTECSLLQFFDVILYGEQKDPSQPRWIGIENVTFLLDELNTTLTDMKNDDLLVYLNDYMEEINVQRDNFKSELRTVHKKFYKPESDEPLDDFCVEFESGSDKMQASYFLTRFHSNPAWYLDPVNVLCYRLAVFVLPGSITKEQTTGLPEEKLTVRLTDGSVYRIDSILQNGDILFDLNDFSKLVGGLFCEISMA
jgi:hypothetical protein